MDKSFVDENYEYIYVCATELYDNKVLGQTIGIRACLNAEGKPAYGDVQFEELSRFVKQYKEYYLTKYGSEIEIECNFSTGIVGNFDISNKYSFST